ncbi:MAG: 50S ribosomal protein L4 [Flavobacteriales bacterium]|jgi:large subunit ribosomal protein L4|tara:strand:- start:12913 stop:13536 length:624 start_codon:yes stop_codon:yes gene_type:complete
MKIAVHSIKGKETTKKVDLSKDIFGVEPNDHAIYLDVKQYLASQRLGTHSSKERGAVKGSRRKLRKQKGSGAARVGDIKNPLFRGGGRVFGPRPRKYDFKVNKKVKRLARKSALSYKLTQNNIIVVEDFNFDNPSTKNYSSTLANFDVLNNKTVLVLDKPNKNIFLSSRNLSRAKVVLASELNTYDIMNANKMLFVESSIKEIENNF